MKKRNLSEAFRAKTFKPGQSGNPKGRPPLTAAQRALRKVTLAGYREIVELALTGNLQELKQVIEDASSSVIEVGIATALFTAIKKGDYAVFERIAERIIGKIPERLEVENTVMSVKLDPKDPAVQAAVKAAMARLQKEF